MIAAKAFWTLSVFLLAASFVTHGGWNGKWFARVRNDAAADRTLYLAWAMLAATLAASI